MSSGVASTSEAPPTPHVSQVGQQHLFSGDIARQQPPVNGGKRHFRRYCSTERAMSR